MKRSSVPCSRRSNSRTSTKPSPAPTTRRTAWRPAIWTRDIKKAHYIARKLQAGTVWINTYNVYDTAAPFGGYKQSGFGREMSAHALEHYTQIKSVWVDLNM